MIDVEDFNRRRSVAALLRGSESRVDEVPRRPNAALGVGLVGVLLFGAAAAGTAYVSHRAPDGWLNNATLVLDRSTGARYVAQDATLRPAPTLTSALLAGATGEPVLVPHEQIDGAPLGPPLPGEDLPERPPSVPDQPRGLTACTSDGSALDVYASTPAVRSASTSALLVRATGSSEVYLVAGRRRWLLAGPALLTLGYQAEQVRDVPASWLDLVAKGANLEILPPTPLDPFTGVAGVGVGGEVVLAATSGRHYLISGGALHPFTNRTSELLGPAPVRSLDDQFLASAPQGDPVGLHDVPSTPPAVPAAEDDVVACVRSFDGAVSVESRAVDEGTRSGTRQELDLGAGATVGVTWHFVPGEGALVGPTTLDDAPEADAPAPETTGIVLVADGVGYPVATLDVLRVLGLRRDQTVKLERPWLALLKQGSTLSTS